jgi:hypothetical protein
MRSLRLLSLASLTVLLAASVAMAQSRPRPSGPPTVHTEEIYEPGPHPGPVPGPYLGPDAGGDCCQDCQQTDCCCHTGCLAAGFAFVFVKPHFENDLAFITTDDTGLTVDTRDTSFDYDTELTPRVWLEFCKSNQLGFRVTYWQFDHAAPQREAEVNETQFQTISTPEIFGDIEIAATQPGDVIGVVSSLDVDVLDWEGTKWTDFCSWQFGTTAGVRYVNIRQAYSAGVFDGEDTLLDAIESSHRFDGVGPTFSLEARRPMGCLTWFSMARGSLLYGDGRSGFTALEDITPAEVGRTTVARFERNDVLTIAEVQVGLEWCRQYCNGRRFFCRTAMEGQIWQGAGNALSADGDLGFFGFHVALGMTL